MSLSVGIVGLPNVGKSTLFNALLQQQLALAANYPFATIEPNIGIALVPDDRLEKLAIVVARVEKMTQLPLIKPTTVEFIDIAGLVKGAHQGEGLGNKFLAYIREVDLICHVLRDFSDENVLREYSVDAKSDREIIETELLLADLATLEKQRQPKVSKDKEELVRWSIITHFIEKVRSGELIYNWIKNEKHNQVAKELGLLTAKKMIYLINVDESQLVNFQAITNHWSQELKVGQESIAVISAKIESELSSLDQHDQQTYLRDLGVDQSGLERLITKAYSFLELQSFLTAGEKEIKAWTIKKNTTASQAAGVIHTDFEKFFIKAKVVDFADFIALGGWKAAKDAGKIRLEGREYLMQKDDVVEFMIGS